MLCLISGCFPPCIELACHEASCCSAAIPSDFVNATGQVTNSRVEVATYHQLRRPSEAVETRCQARGKASMFLIWCYAGGSVAVDNDEVKVVVADVCNVDARTDRFVGDDV
eukprot:5921291-Amphidinium_carterae.1